MFNRESAKALPEWLQDTFFMMVVSNSCVNPIVYGSYAINCKQTCNCLTCWGKGSVNRNLSKFRSDLSEFQYPFFTIDNNLHYYFLNPKNELFYIF